MHVFVNHHGQVLYAIKIYVDKVLLYINHVIFQENVHHWEIMLHDVNVMKDTREKIVKSVVMDFVKEVVVFSRMVVQVQHQKERLHCSVGKLVDVHIQNKPVQLIIIGVHILVVQMKKVVKHQNVLQKMIVGSHQSIIVPLECVVRQ